MLKNYASASLIGLIIGSLFCGAAVLILFSFRPQPNLLPTEVVSIPVVLETHSPTPSLTATFTPTLTLTSTLLPPSPTRIPNTATASAIPPSSTPIPPSATDDPCKPPEDWIEHTVEAGETLFAFQLGVDSAVTVDEMMAVNCLTDRMIYENQVLWLPPGAVENAPSSAVRPTPFSNISGGERTPLCPCELTIPQALRLEQIAELVDSVPVAFRGSEFLSAARRTYTDYSFLAGASSLEGYILPATYTLSNETTAQDFVFMALDQFGQATADLWTVRSDYSAYQLVILASVINRESRAYGQQVLVSSVFHNRLKSGRGLGASVTLQYALGKPDNWYPSVQGLISNYDSPYNTNIYGGFPPSPIASPSLDALRAAVYPAETNFLYFTASCTGSGNAFAETYEQHRANANCQ